MKTEIMYIEDKCGSIRGDGLICSVTRSKSGRTIYYKELILKPMRGYKVNYYDEVTGDEYWVSHPKKNGQDSLYSEMITIDDDVREEYWTSIRNKPENKQIKQIGNK